MCKAHVKENTIMVKEIDGTNWLTVRCRRDFLDK